MVLLYQPTFFKMLNWHSSSHKIAVVWQDCSRASEVIEKDMTKHRSQANHPKHEEVQVVYIILVA